MSTDKTESSTFRAIESSIFVPNGRCIYCGFASELSDEHVLPYGLDGNLVLRAASCSECARATCRIENRVLRTMWGAARTDIARRNKPRHPKDAKKLQPLLYVDALGQPRKVMLPLEEHPRTLPFPIYDRPEIFDQAEPRNPTAPYQIRCVLKHLNADNSAALAKRIGARNLRVGRVDVASFAMMLAKIGHCFAYAAIEGFPRGYKPLLCGIILDRSLAYPHYVGCDSESSDKPANFDHQITDEDMVIRGTQYLTTAIRLFGGLQSPTYRVVVAERAA